MTDRLRALFIDGLSIARGKYLPASKIADASTRFARGVFATHYDRDLLIDAPGALVNAGIPDMELRWRAEDIRASWEPDTKVVLGDLFDADGAPLSLCPRGALKRAIADWGRHGLKPKIGIELEAYALQGDEAGRLRP
ncbi:MAG: glutamine synthetase, partial [Pseudomonadota bacterium]